MPTRRRGDSYAGCDLAARIRICMSYLCSNYRGSSSNRYPCPLQLFLPCTTRIWNITSAVKAPDEALSPRPRVFLDFFFFFPGEMLRSDEHHPSCPPHGFPSATTPSGRAAAAALTPSSSRLLFSPGRHHLPTPTPATAHDSSNLKNKTGNDFNRGCGGWQRRVERSSSFMWAPAPRRNVAGGWMFAQPFMWRRDPHLFFYSLPLPRPIVVVVPVSWVWTLPVAAQQRFVGLRGPGAPSAHPR